MSPTLSHMKLSRHTAQFSISSRIANLSRALLFNAGMRSP